MFGWLKALGANMLEELKGKPVIRTVRITRAVLIGATIRQPGDLVEVPEGDQLDRLFESRAAVCADIGLTPDPESFKRKRMGTS